MNNTKFIFKIFKKLMGFSLFVVRYIINLILSIVVNFLKNLGKRLRFSITFKMTVIYAFIFSILLILISNGILFGFRHFLITKAETSIHINSQIVSTYIKEKSEIPNSIINQIANTEKINFTVFNENKQAVFATEKTKNPLGFYENLDMLSIIDNDQGQLMILNTPITSNNKIIYLQLNKSLYTENLYLKTLFIILVAADLTFLLILIIISSKTSKKMLAPIEDMTKTAKKISAEALDTRLNVSGSKDELKDLAETFNAMIDRIQQSYEQQKQFVSDASHELRTPIAVIQGYANLLSRWGKEDKNVLEESIAAIKSESDNMKNLVENLLFLARGDKNSQKFQIEKFFLNELMDEIIKETRLIDDNHKILCQSNLEIEINADRKLLKEAIRIFIHNSIKFTPEGGTIELKAKQDKKITYIIVEDTGVGISEEDLPYIFNRFYTADKSRTKNSAGNGLGLSIAKWIIEKHKGNISVASKLGIGTKITISLPSKNNL